MSSDRVYADGEVIEVIEQVIKHQESERSRRPERGLTLAELERLGEEVGIRPEHLRRAAAQVDLSGRSASRRLGSEGLEAQAERWIPGRLSDGQIKDALAALKNHLGTSSSWWGSSGDAVRRMGCTYEWTHGNVHGQTRIALTDYGDGYALRVFRPQYGGTVAFGAVLGVPLAFLLGIAPVALVAETLGPLWAVMLAVSVYAFSVALAHRTLRRSRAHAQQEPQCTPAFPASQ